MKKIVITGATGMIGTALIEETIKQNIAVTAIIRKNSTRIKPLLAHPLVNVLHADLSEYKRFVPQETGFDAFFHLAWDKTYGKERDNVDLQMQNIAYTLDAVRLAKRMQCKAFVGTGSQAEYGVQPCALAIDTPCNPQSGYGIAKYSAGKLAKLLCKELDLKFSWARILSVFGKDDAPHTLISSVIQSLKNGTTLALSPCEQTWDYLYQKDAARALLAIAFALTKNCKNANGANCVDGKVYPLGSGSARMLKDYVLAIQNFMQTHNLLAKTNAPILNFGSAPYYPHQTMHLVADISALTADTGFVPSFSFEEALCDMFGVQKI